MGKGDYEKGQKDGSEGHHDKPFDLLDGLLGTGDYARDSAQRNANYEKGYTNGRDNPKK